MHDRNGEKLFVDDLCEYDEKLFGNLGSKGITRIIKIDDHTIEGVILVSDGFREIGDTLIFYKPELVKISNQV